MKNTELSQLSNIDLAESIELFSNCLNLFVSDFMQVERHHSKEYQTLRERFDSLLAERDKREEENTL